MCGLSSLGEIHHHRYYEDTQQINMQVRLDAFTHLCCSHTGGRGQLHVNNGSFVSTVDSNASCGVEFDLQVRN